VGLIKYLKETGYLYDNLIATQMMVKRNISMRNRRFQTVNDKIHIDFNGTYDGTLISYFYVVEKLPKELMLQFKDRLRRECKGGVRLSFLNHLSGHRIDWNSPQMKARLRILRQVSHESESQVVDAFNLHENVASLSSQRWLEESLKYLAISDKERMRALLKMSMLMIISGERGTNFDDSVKAITNAAAQMQLKIERVLYEVSDVVSLYLPFSKTSRDNLLTQLPVQVLTDEIIARLNTYNQGILGKRGIYFGTDVYSRFPVIKKVKAKNFAAENWLVTAETGGGKSFLIKALILQLLALNYNGTIMDIEGFEYIPIALFMKNKSRVEIVNMAEGSGKYFDPVEIPALTGIEEIDRDAKNMSTNFTLAVFKTLLGVSYDRNEWLDIVLNDAVAQTYLRAGVTEDMDTWKNSRELSLHSVYENLRTLTQHRKEEQYSAAVGQSIAIVGRYFEASGNRAEIFREKIAVEQIMEADLVVCSFGMAGKSPQAVDQIQLSLMQLSAAQMSHQRSIFSKSKGKFNFKLWEEFQRWGKFPDSDKTIGVAVTGGRKLGDVNIIITNVVRELLTNDVFGILSNITSFFVGAIADAEVRSELCHRMSIPNMIPELHRISSASTVRDEESEGESRQESIFTHAFLCGLDRSKYGIVKMLLPPELATSKLFETGVDLNG
jgi:hypothetical protein